MSEQPVSAGVGACGAPAGASNEEVPLKSLTIKVLVLALTPTLAIAAGAGAGTGGASGGTGANGSTGSTAPGTAGAAPGANGAAAPGNSGAVGKGPAITESMLPEEPSVAYGQPLEVGVTLPGDFTYYPVPNYEEYNYVVLDNQRVIVDSRTHRIIEVIP